MFTTKITKAKRMIVPLRRLVRVDFFFFSMCVSEIVFEFKVFSRILSCKYSCPLNKMWLRNTDNLVQSEICVKIFDYPKT